MRSVAFAGVECGVSRELVRVIIETKWSVFVRENIIWIMRKTIAAQRARQWNFKIIWKIHRRMEIFSRGMEKSVRITVSTRRRWNAIKWLFSDLKNVYLIDPFRHLPYCLHISIRRIRFTSARTRTSEQWPLCRRYCNANFNVFMSTIILLSEILLTKGKWVSFLFSPWFADPLAQRH